MADLLPERALLLRPADVAAVRTVADLGQVLRSLRRREARRREGAELTYRHLAAKAGWSHAVVAGYLTGRTLPPTDRFDTLIRLLGASPAEQGALATARDRVEDARRDRHPDPYRTSGGPPGPRQLPADVPGFVGRATDLANLDRMLAVSRRPGPVVIAAVTGTAGVGKTALIVHWAHRVKHRFPHGQLYADLGGYGPDRPATPERVLDCYLTGLGVAPGWIPRGLEAKTGMYRSLLDRRRVLVVLDNAVSPQQIRPLLPGSPGCLVAVTSRNTLTGLAARDRANRIWLDALPPEDAVRLLAGFVGERRVAAEPAAARRLAQLCDHLPVALCAAGERAAAHPYASLASLVAELAGAGDRLDLLDAGGDSRTALRTVFSWSYRQLPAEAARLFRSLGRRPGADIDLRTTTALIGAGSTDARRLLDALVAANLLRPVPPDRYRLPVLLHAYAAELTPTPALIESA